MLIAIILLSFKLYKSNIKLKSTEVELSEAQSKLEEVSEKLGSSSEELETKIDNIQSYASELESSIDNLVREIRWVDCDACSDEVWDIERKAKDVVSDFESLQSEINNW